MRLKYVTYVRGMYIFQILNTYADIIGALQYHDSSGLVTFNTPHYIRPPHMDFIINANLDKLKKQAEDIITENFLLGG